MPETLRDDNTLSVRDDPLFNWKVSASQEEHTHMKGL
jgi:hypothetical protein